MGEDVRREQAESKKKIQQAADKRAGPKTTGEGARFRNSPGGRRLAALRKKKLQKE